MVGRDGVEGQPAKTEAPAASVLQCGTLSELLSIAHRCLKDIRQDKRYVIDFHAWHDPQGDGCHVDLAGALMAKLLAANPSTELAPEDFKEPERHAMYALDCLAKGDAGAAATRFKKFMSARGLKYQPGRAFALGRLQFIASAPAADLDGLIAATVTSLRDAGA